MSAAWVRRVLRDRDERGQVLSSSVAVVSVIAVVVAMVAFFAGVGDEPADNSQVARSEATPSSGPSPAEGAQPAGTDRRQDEARDNQEPEQAHRSREQRDRGPRTEKPERTQPEDVVPDVYVEVYNNTAVSGLAGSKAAVLQDAGWQVVGIDNWHGDIPASTVYHPGHLTAEAQQLAGVLGISRTHEAVAPMRFDRLTVILTDDLA